jgi:hypothetical protein
VVGNGLHIVRSVASAAAARALWFNAVASNYTPVSNLDILFVSGSWLGRPDGLSDPSK